MQRRNKRRCRTCPKLLLENQDSEAVRVDDGRGGYWTEDRKTPNGTFGYHGSGICSLRCGFAWADKRADRAPHPRNLGAS